MKPALEQDKSAKLASRFIFTWGFMSNFHELITGFHSFRNEYLLKDREFFEQLAHGQNPKTLVIACCDSRTDPAIILGCKPGDLFVVRSIAAIVPDKESSGEHDAVIAAIEYGIKHLQVHDIVVMGHSNCGGIHGLLNPEKINADHYISRWVSLACPALERIDHENPCIDETLRGRLCEEGAVLLSIENLLSYEWIHDAVDAGRLCLHAAYYDLQRGTLSLWNSESEDFESVGMTSV